MSLSNLLALDDDSIEVVTAAVSQWCGHHKVPLESSQGQEAMSEAIRLAAGGEKSPAAIVDKLSQYMRVAHYKYPTE